MAEVSPKAKRDVDARWQPPRADESDCILTLTQAVGVVPLSRSTLYRVAEAGGEDSPFRKCGGRWLTTRSDLFRWVRGGERGSAGEHHRPHPRSRSSFAEKVAQLEGSAQ